MTRFESKVLGIAKIVADIDCGARHGGNWRLPCPECVQQERDGIALLHQEISNENVRRHMQLGHDQRDGNQLRKRVPTGVCTDEKGETQEAKR